jgi:hypothetical protein
LALFTIDTLKYETNFLVSIVSAATQPNIPLPLVF